MTLSFELSMPGRGSWNGGWSGEDRRWIILKTYTSQKAIARAVKIQTGGPYYYNWSDGWGARVDVRQVDATEARKLRKASAGFAGYDWMVETICEFGKILDSAQESQRRRENALASAERQP